jgi:hypothetical protein
MRRTATRPIPSGRVQPGEALAFGLTLSALSVMTLGAFVDWLAASLLAFTIFFYAVIYTMWLKRWTAQNIVIGGAAGAFPPMIAWAAATGTIGLESVILFLMIFGARFRRHLLRHRLSHARPDLRRVRRRCLAQGTRCGGAAGGKASVRFLDPLSLSAVRRAARRRDVPVMAAVKRKKGIVLTEQQKRTRRMRSIALGLVLAGFAILFYLVTIVKLGPGVFNRPI